MRRVLIYAPIIGRGGVHRMIERLTTEWAKNSDYEFIALSQRFDEIGEPIDWPVAFEQIDGGEPPRHPKLFNWLYANQREFYAHWKRTKADLAYLPMPWWTARVPRFEPPMPTVITLHDFSWDQLGQRNHEFRAEARAFAHSQNLTAVFPSDYQREWGEKNYGFKHTRTIYHGHFIPEVFLATPFEAERVQKMHNLPNSYILAFHCGNAKKDPVTILKAQALARNTNDSVPPLVLAGLETELFNPAKATDSTDSDNPTFHDRVRVLTKELGFTIGVDLFVLGAVDEDDIAGLYAGAAGAVTATTNEGGISGTMFEAFAAYTPVAFTNLPIFSERLNPMDAYGWPFDVGDEKGLAMQIIRICTLKEETAARSARAFAFGNSRTWADAAGEYTKLFDEVLGENARHQTA